MPKRGQNVIERPGGSGYRDVKGPLPKFWQSHDGRRASRYSGLVIAFDDSAFNVLVHIRQ
jgi:hypothetical protein